MGFITDQARPTLLVVPTVYRDFDFEAMAKRIVGRSTGSRGPGRRPRTARRRPFDAFRIPSRRPAAAADAPVRWLFYTSGTTADPKGAPHTDLTVMASALAMCECLEITADDVSGSGLPVHPHRRHRLADGRPLHRLHPAHHGGVRPGGDAGLLGQRERDPGRLGHTVPSRLPGRPAGSRHEADLPARCGPTRGVARPSRRSSTTT